MRRGLLLTLLLASTLACGTGAVGQQSTATGDAAALDAQDFEARYREAENYRRANGVDLDVARSIEIHRELAEAGFGRSLNRMGDYHYYGTGLPQDYRRAADFYAAAAEAGHSTSLVRQSKALRRLGAGEEALAAIERAIELHVDGALEERASGHLYADYGGLSDVSFGFEETVRLASDPGNEVANYQLAEAFRRGIGVAPDQNRAFELYSVLRQQGHSAATERLAGYYAEGIATQRDPETALELYRAAASLGREGAYVPMSKLLVEIGRGEDALLALQTGVELGNERAEVEIAIGHIDALFGAESDPEFGRVELNRLAEAGNLRAAAMVLNRLGDGEPLEPDLDRVISHMDNAVQRGDGRAAETLLRYYREVPDAFADTLERRRTILDNHAPIIRARTYYPELANLAYDTNVGVGAYPLLLEIVQEADGVGYERTLLQISWRDKNAFTYILQSELTERGHYDGRLSGYMTGETVRSVLRYCYEKEIYDTCIHGPLRTPAVRLIAVALRRDREVAAGLIREEG